MNWWGVRGTRGCDCPVPLSHSIMSNSLQLHGLHFTRFPCPSPSPGACSNSCPLSWWCHPTISFSVVPFISCLQSFPALESFLLSQLFESSGHSIGDSASTSVFLMNIQDWFPLGLTGLISLKSKGHSRIDAFELWCWRRLLRIPLTERRSNQAILKEINSEYSLE